MKICSICNFPKPISEFNKNLNSGDLHRPECKECQHQSNKEYRENNPDVNKNYYKNHKDEILEKDRQEYLANPEIKKARARNWYYANKETVLGNRTKYRKENPELIKQRKADAYYKNKAVKDAKKQELALLWQGPKIPDHLKLCSRCFLIIDKGNFKLKNKETGTRAAWCDSCFRDAAIKWNQNNPEKCKKREQTYQENGGRKKQKKNYRQTDKYKTWRDKYRSNPQVLLYDRCSQRIRAALKVVGATKTKRSSELVGCSWVELETHLKSTLPPSVTWEMVLSGDAHIDHKIPTCSFDLTNIHEQRKCFNWQNLRILDGPDNCSKATQDKELSIRNILVLV